MEPWMQHAIDEYNATNHDDGDLLSHDWLKWALQIPEPKNMGEVQDIQWKMLSRMDAFRDYLLADRKVALQNVRGYGYRIVPPSEQAQYASEQAMKHIRKGIERGSSLMENTRMDSLDDSQRQRHIDAEAKLAGISHMMNRQRKDVFALFRPAT